MDATKKKPHHKNRTGVVVSDKMDKTVVVAVETRRPHPLYRRVIRRTTKFKAHDETNACKLGDMVRIEETRPLSKDKRWRVVEILSRHEVPEVAPTAIE
ncbi:MAG TPA: 30S ribosomal protein S17 [Dehalococcoidia bacterium]|nr:30S ribosomal protein S17 [Dehalococcoidia bacterium]